MLRRHCRAPSSCSSFRAASCTSCKVVFWSTLASSGLLAFMVCSRLSNASLKMSRACGDVREPIPVSQFDQDVFQPFENLAALAIKSRMIVKLFFFVATKRASDTPKVRRSCSASRPGQPCQPSLSLTQP